MPPRGASAPFRAPLNEKARQRRAAAGAERGTGPPRATAMGGPAGRSPPAGKLMRILVAHFVSAARTGGMSRLVGTVHDRLAAAGHQVSYLTTDDVPPPMRSRLGRLAF